MTTAIESPKDPLLPPAANQLWVSDSWTNSLGAAPQFAYKVQYATKETVVDLNYLNISMTDVQWQKWSVDADDKEYILDCITENLGLVRA